MRFLPRSASSNPLTSLLIDVVAIFLPIPHDNDEVNLCGLYAAEEEFTTEARSHKENLKTGKPRIAFLRVSVPSW
jgi:hypothetical protein